MSDKKLFYIQEIDADYTPNPETQAWLDELARAYNAGESFHGYGKIIDIPRMRKITGNIGGRNER